MCPVPVVPVAALVPDVVDLMRERRQDLVVRDWIVASVSATEVDTAPAACARRLGRALRFPDADALMGDDLAPLAWLALRGVRHHAPASGDEADPGQDMQRGRWDAVIARVAALPVVAVSEEPPVDEWYRELSELWPQLPPAARRGLLAAAKEWVKRS